MSQPAVIDLPVSDANDARAPAMLPWIPSPAPPGDTSRWLETLTLAVAAGVRIAEQKRTGDVRMLPSAREGTGASSDLASTLRSVVREVVREEMAALAETRPEPDAYLSTAAAASIAGVAEGTIRRWVREGWIPGHRAGRVLRVRTSDLQRLLESGARSPKRDARCSPEELARRDFGGLKKG